MLPCTFFKFDVHSEAACILNVCPSILDTYIYTYCYILLYIRLPPAEETMPFWMMMMMMMMMMIMVVKGKTSPTQVAQCQDHLGHKYRSGMQQPNAGSTRANLH